MSRKYTRCIVENCIAPHRRNGYCTNHSQKLKRGTLEIYPHSKLCKHPNCFKKYYAAGYCIMHRQRKIKNLPMNMEHNTKDEYLRGNFDFVHLDINSWSKSVKNIFSDRCMVCGWNKTSCDTHHIIPKSKNGLNSLKNAVILCPNHHRLAHENKITIDELQKLTDSKIAEIETQNIEECV